MSKVFKYIKRTILVIVIICFLITSILISKIVINDRFIANYPNEDQEYRLVILSMFNFYEPYIVHYNYGNYYYQKELYEDAIEKYKEALSYKVKKNHYCPINMNLSLALEQEAELLKNENHDKYLELLVEARSYLQDCIDMKIDSKENKIDKSSQDDKDDKSSIDKDSKENENNKDSEPSEEKQGNQKGNQGQSGDSGDGNQGNNEIGEQQQEASEMASQLDQKIGDAKGQQENQSDNGSKDSEDNEQGQSSQQKDQKESDGSGPSDKQLDELKERAEQAKRERDEALNQRSSDERHSHQIQPKDSIIDSKGCVDCL